MVAIIFWKLKPWTGCYGFVSNRNPDRNPGPFQNVSGLRTGPKVRNPGAFSMVAIRVANRVSITISQPWNVLEQWWRPGFDQSCGQGCDQGCKSKIYHKNSWNFGIWKFNVFLKSLLNLKFTPIFKKNIRSLKVWWII